MPRAETQCCHLYQKWWYRWWHLALMTLTYVTGELSHFLVAIVSRKMAQEIHYGDIGCVDRDNVTETPSVECYTFSDNTSCLTQGAGTCQWEYTGLGLQYQALAGTAFIEAFCVSGLLLGALADRFNRQRLLTFCLFLLTVSTLLMGFATKYWHLVLFRMMTAAGEAGFMPLSAGMIADLFPASSRGVAMSVLTWGVYFGYGISFVVGNYVTQANIGGLGWRWAYYIAAIPGALLVCLHFSADDPRVTMATPKEQNTDAQLGENLSNRNEKEVESASPDADADAPSSGTSAVTTGTWQNLRRMVALCARAFCQPGILVLFFASCLRQTAGFCWSTNTQLYYQTYYPAADLGLWLSWVSMVGGSVGVTAGGMASDWLVRRFGVGARIWILSASQLLATPFAVGTLYFPPQGCFISLLIAYLFAEMWFGVVHTIVVEMVPASVRSTTTAVFHFIINNVGGNMPLAVQAISQAYGLREALYILYPGMYFGSAIVYLLTAFVLRRGKDKAQAD